MLLLVLANSIWSCSTKKNTWAARNYHQMKTKYNIYHNGSISFQEGEEIIRETNKDDYSDVLNLYPVSNHSAAEASTSQMDRTIEKCRKCIKLHSIKSRPKINYEKKRRNPEYAAWLEQEEFNGCKVMNDFNRFARKSDVIIANRYDDKLEEVRNKVYTRDLFSKD